MNDRSSNGAPVASGVDRLTAQVADGMERLFGEATPKAVFSAPHVVGDSLVISAATWERVGGFGFGGGSGPADEGGGGGGGGGGSSVVRPVAVVRITPTGIEVKPVIDLTKLGVTVVLSALGVWRILRK